MFHTRSCHTLLFVPSFVHVPDQLLADSGKTTLTESILSVSNYLQVTGSVDTGSTTTDFLPTERERGITIQSASIPVKWKDYTFNLIDTPGHADFGMEVESASRVIDGAVVLMDGVEGVEAQTKGVWGQLNRHNVPTRLLFINKLDRPGASVRDSLLSLLSHRLHPTPILIALPVASFNPETYLRGEPGIKGVVDLAKWEVWKWESDSKDATRHALPISQTELQNNSVFPPGHPLLEHLAAARTEFIDSIAVLSPDLLSEIIEDNSNTGDAYLQVPSSAVLSSLRELTLRKEILPVFCGSALKHVGTELLMDYVGELLASPADVDRLGHPGAAISKKPGLVQLLAWKVGWDKRKGWMTFVRIYAGTLTRQTSLLNTSTQKKERISKLLLPYASEQEEVDSLPYGSVGVILGLQHTRTGDTLISTFSPSGTTERQPLPAIVPPPATISATIIAQTQSDMDLVKDALTALSRTDPSVRCTEEEGQILVHGLGALHLEIVEGRLRDEFGIQCQMGKRQVSYREAFPEGLEIEEAMTWTKEVNGKPSQASVTLVVRPMKEGEQPDEGWNGNIVVRADNGTRLPATVAEATARSFSPDFTAIIQGLSGPLSASPHTHLPLLGLHVGVQKFSNAPGSPSAALAVASTALLRNILQGAGPGDVMEPYIRVKVDVPETAMGKVVKDLTEHNGEILDLESGASAPSNSTVDYLESTPYATDTIYVPPRWVSPCAGAHTGELVDAARLRRSIHAIAPLSKMLDYTTRLRAVSGGQATFTMSTLGFRRVGPVRRLEVLRELGRA